MNKQQMGKQAMGKQQGLTLISWVIVLVFILFQGVIAMRIIPVYLTDSSVGSIMEGLKTDVSARGLTAKELKRLVARRLDINNVYTISQEEIVVKKGRDENVIVIDYEPRGTLFKNLDYIISFHHEVRIPRN